MCYVQMFEIVDNELELERLDITAVFPFSHHVFEPVVN